MIPAPAAAAGNTRSAAEGKKVMRVIRDRDAGNESADLNRIDGEVAMKHSRTRYTVPGFVANGIAVGIKGEGGKDLSLIVSEKPAAAAGVFTSNAAKAAPVLLDMERIRKGVAQAVIVNSGNANAATGEKGYRDAVAMAASAASALKIPEDLVLVGSTGMIGQRLPIGKIRKGMGTLVKGLHPDGFSDAEAGIMTTDRFPKIGYRSCWLDGKKISLCGLAKGAGMIEPHMATLLSFIVTDAAIESDALDRCLRKGIEESFNAISVDGCMSTNDTVILLANGSAGNKTLGNRSRQLASFQNELSLLLRELALSIVRDGEGATKVIAVRAEGAASRNAAKKMAYAIARSNLVKAAFFGKDPNWGRILQAVGAAEPRMKPELLELFFDDILLFKGGRGVNRNERKLRSVMEKEHIQVCVRLGMGTGTFTVYASDLTHDYVTLNAHYHT